jgi:predicted ATPase/DNA-binding winged helix-turn-helix (wHTH) protein
MVDDHAIHMSKDESAQDDVIAFGPFCLREKERRLERNGVDVKIGSRALEILIALAGRAGEVVTKEELNARVWPDTSVEESGLRVHISALRKALGDGQDGARYVTNVPGRGYCFVGKLSSAGLAPPPRAPRGPTEKRKSHLPPRLGRIIGRDDLIGELAAELATTRFLSIVGPGGMGKTTVAIAVAHALDDDFGGDVRFVDLGALTDERHVATSVASAVGMALLRDDAAVSLTAFLQERRTLIVLDGGEHVMATLAPLVEHIFAGATQVHFLITSREPLRVEGENVHRMAPLDGPPLRETITAAEVLAFPAVQLLVERANAGGARLAIDDGEAPLVAQICHRLDGIALAIEIAAGRIEAYGVRGTASLLENRFRLLWHGRRTALPRHRTLTSMLDWSYNLLSDVERTVLRRLSIFVGAFSLDAAVAATAHGELDGEAAIDALGRLVEKSLLSANPVGATLRYRLLDTTRSYAQGKLDDAGERSATARRLAKYLCRVLDEHDEAQEELGNVRASLTWCFSDAGEIALGTALAAATAPMFAELSLLSECQQWSSLALGNLEAAERGTRREMVLQAALGVSSMFTRGNSDEAHEALRRGLALADELDDPVQQIRMLGALDIFLTRVGEFRDALAIAQRSEATAQRLDDRGASLISDWMIGTNLHLLGRQVEAEQRCRTALAPPPVTRAMTKVHFGFDHRVRALVALCRTLWLVGRAEDANDVATLTLHEAAQIGQPVTMAIALVWTSSVFAWIGDLPRAVETIEKLIAFAGKHALNPYRAVGLALKGELTVRRGDAAAGLELLQPAVATLRVERHDILQTVFATAIAEGLGMVGRHGEALATLERAIAATEKSGASFHLPEMLRLQGHLLATMPAQNVEEAERCVGRAMALAKQQGAIAWELRAAMTLARLPRRGRRAAEAHDLLAACYERFTQGLDTADLKQARLLLSER